MQHFISLCYSKIYTILNAINQCIMRLIKDMLKIYEHISRGKKIENKNFQSQVCVRAASANL